MLKIFYFCYNQITGLPICLLIKYQDFEILMRGIILNYNSLKIVLNA